MAIDVDAWTAAISGSTALATSPGLEGAVMYIIYIFGPGSRITDIVRYCRFSSPSGTWKEHH